MVNSSKFISNFTTAYNALKMVLLFPLNKALFLSTFHILRPKQLIKRDKKVLRQH